MTMYLWDSSSRLGRTTVGHNTVEWPRTLDTACEVRIHADRSSADPRDQVRQTNSPGNPCQRWYSGWDASDRRMPTSSQWPRREHIELETPRSCSTLTLWLIDNKKTDGTATISGKLRYNTMGRVMLCWHRAAWKQMVMSNDQGWNWF